jgi:hypothetical protein
MFICNAKPEWQWDKKLAKLDPVSFRSFINRAPSFRQAVLKTRGADSEDHSEVSQTEAAKGGHHMYDGLLMDVHEVEAWTEAGIELSMSKVKGLGNYGGGRDLPTVIYQVSVANVGLMQVQCVEILENCCTDELQRWLDKGWRILAVCPPNDARRPSYVVGHVDKEPHR